MKPPERQSIRVGTNIRLSVIDGEHLSCPFELRGTVTDCMDLFAERSDVFITMSDGARIVISIKDPGRS